MFKIRKLDFRVHLLYLKMTKLWRYFICQYQNCAILFVYISASWLLWRNFNRNRFNRSFKATSKIAEVKLLSVHSSLVAVVSVCPSLTSDWIQLRPMVNFSNIIASAIYYSIAISIIFISIAFSSTILLETTRIYA